MLVRSIECFLTSNVSLLFVIVPKFVSKSVNLEALSCIELTDLSVEGLAYAYMIGYANSDVFLGCSCLTLIIIIIVLQHEFK